MRTLLIILMCPLFGQAQTVGIQPRIKYEPTGIYAKVQEESPLELPVKVEKPEVVLPRPDPTPLKSNEVPLTNTDQLMKANKQGVKAFKRQDYSAYKPWFVDGHNTTDSHLINKHGVNPSELVGLSPDQKNRLHGKMHGEHPHTTANSRITTPVFQPRTVATGGCPGGVCPWNSGYAGRRFRRR